MTAEATFLGLRREDERRHRVEGGGRPALAPACSPDPCRGQRLVSGHELNRNPLSLPPRSGTWHWRERTVGGQPRGPMLARPVVHEVGKTGGSGIQTGPGSGSGPLPGTTLGPVVMKGDS
ncbi:hypothetical protein NDU88_006293 [Pleurodeles waltl]|uniref:Uncharacterized protein n=1 Tax=Pleurodeles waltl TaxID=8319 RepID=A0AAV7LNQ2_PLEWA|nr:hypothetical protein NDU88_006293 [Pleurodeles waltl]